MEPVPLENVEAMDTDPSSDCLDTPVVLRAVMKHFSNDELLNYSLVNKLWNYEARSELRDRSCLMAHLKSGHPCKDLLTFASHLQTMNVIPFSGIHIFMDATSHQDQCESSPTGDLDLPYKLILDQLSWKQLSVTLHGHWELHKSCPGFLLVKSILQHRCGTLEEFSLNLESKRRQFFRDALRNSNFPRLKVLKIYGLSDTMDGTHTNFVKELVSRSPNLEELYHEKHINLMANALEGSSAVLLTDYEFNPNYDEFSDDIIEALRLKKMRLHYVGRDFNVERFNRRIPMILQISCTTLNSLYIDAVFLVPLMCYGISLDNVTQLEIDLNYHYLELVLRNVFRFLKAFDFTRIFPRLSRVEIDNFPGGTIAPGQFRVLLEQGNAEWKDPMPDRAANIKHLRVPLKDYSVQFFAQMFPDIESLVVEATRGPEVPYGLIWDNWVNLRELQVKNTGMGSLVLSAARTTWNENLDTIFCGIFPEEVAQLREKDDEYLEAVNIVPVMPSITCLRELRTFKLLNTELGFSSRETDHTHTFIFSRVTGIIAFKRCPNLSVTLATNSNQIEKALGHVKPYADIVLAKHYNPQNHWRHLEQE